MSSTENTTGVREGYISVPGGKVWYLVAGAERPGIPLLALHGGPGAPHDYQETFLALADERPVILYDQLGCGNSERPDDLSLWTVERFCEELAQIREALGLTEVHILGQSWGSMLAVDYILAKHPLGVRSLVLSAPCLSASRWEADQHAYLEELPAETRRTISDAEQSGEFGAAYQEAMMEYYRRHVCRMDPWPDCVNRAFEKMGQAVYEYMWGKSEFTLTGTLRDYERAHRLHEITVPVLITCGEHDEASPRTCAYYQSRFPAAELLVIEDASHMHHVEKADEYLAVVRDFLRRAEGR